MRIEAFRVMIPCQLVRDGGSDPEQGDITPLRNFGKHSPNDVVKTLSELLVISRKHSILNHSTVYLFVPQDSHTNSGHVYKPITDANSKFEPLTATG